MKSDVRMKLSWIIVVAGFAVFATPPWAMAQDNFREFERRMVVTPAELFEALATLQPSSEQAKQLKAEQQKKLEEAGREFLSKLTPEEKEKALEFTEKFLRKNGADATSSQKLLEQFGLPIELQKEISEQFRKYGNDNTGSDPSSRHNDAREDEIGQLLRKAREKFNSDSSKRTPDGKSPGSKNPGTPQQPNAGGDQNGNAGAGADSSPKPKLPTQGDRSRQEDSTDPDRANPKLKPATANNQSAQNGNKNGADQNGNAGGTPKPSVPRATDRSANQNRNRQFPRLNRNRGKPTGESDVTSNEELERLLGLGGPAKNVQRKRPKRRTNANAGDGSVPSTTDDLDWTKVIKDLAEKGRTDAGSAAPLASGSKGASTSGKVLDAAELQRVKELLQEMSSSNSINPDTLKRAQDLISRSMEGQKQARSNARRKLASQASKSDEKVGTRFDRLLVKAAQRTLSSDDDGESGVSKDVSSMFGDLIERVQKQAAKKKEERAESAKRNSRDRGQRGNRNGSSANKSQNTSQVSNSSNSGNSSSGSNSNSGSQPNDPFQQSNPSSSDTSVDPGKILESLPDFSGINPTHVFTFFAIVGLVFFVGYLLAQSVVGSEAMISQRKVIRQIRETKLKSPKDLIETVDMFVLSKFGIKSSWWNAGVVHNVLASSSPELKSQVDELIQDYIRARYMRANIQISSADQQRYRKTLEELSLVDIKPARKLELVSTSLALGSATSAEG